MNRHRKTFTVVATIGLLATAACSRTHSNAPDPSGDQVHNIVNPYVVTNPYGFRNVVIGCDGLGDMLFITSRGQSTDAVTSGIFVIPNDPRCIGKRN